MFLFVVDGTGPIFGKGMKRPKPGRTKVVFGAPLWPSEDENTRRYNARVEAAVRVEADLPGVLAVAASITGCDKNRLAACRSAGLYVHRAVADHVAPAEVQRPFLRRFEQPPRLVPAAPLPCAGASLSYTSFAPLTMTVTLRG